MKFGFACSDLPRPTRPTHLPQLRHPAPSTMQFDVTISFKICTLPDYTIKSSAGMRSAATEHDSASARGAASATEHGARSARGSGTASEHGSVQAGRSRSPRVPCVTPAPRPKVVAKPPAPRPKFMVMPAQNNPDPQGVFATEQNGFVVCRERTCRSVRMNVFAEDLAIQCAVCGTFPWLQPAVDGIPEFGTALARAMQATANADAAGDQVDADQSMAPAR